MVDRYQRMVNTGPGRFVARRLGLPTPVPLRRHRPGDPVSPGPVRFGPGRLTGGAVGTAVAAVLRDAGVDAHDTDVDGARPAALLFDATALAGIDDLRALYDFFGPRIRSVAPNGRLIVFGRPAADCPDPERAVAQRALEGFVRSLGKEARGGRTAQLVRVAEGAEGGLGSTVRFLLSARSAYVSGQVVRVGPGHGAPEPADPERPLAGQVAVVTGAARGIGEAIAGTLAADGAHVVCVDLPDAAEPLRAVADAVGGSTVLADITDPDGPDELIGALLADHGGAHVVVHNAGITRDRTLARMSGSEWDSVLAVNLAAQHRITGRLLERDALAGHARIVLLSSVAGIAGNYGQTNYATSKAGVIGLAEAYAGPLAGRGATVNAVAPGFIETRLTARMPLAVREVGRRANSMSQGGLPVDVAQTVGWLAHPGSGGISGTVVRVCGQSLLGA